MTATGRSHEERLQALTNALASGARPTAEGLGLILERMAEVETFLGRSDYQAAAIEKAGIAWKDLTAEEMIRHILPRLRPQNQPRAFQKWKQAQPAAAVSP